MVPLYLLFFIKGLGKFAVWINVEKGPLQTPE